MTHLVIEVSAPVEQPGPGLYYLLVQPWGVYVKEGSFFIEQGGLKDEWGSHWIPVQANSIEHAIRVGKSMSPYRDHHDEYDNYIHY